MMKALSLGGLLTEAARLAALAGLTEPSPLMVGIAWLGLVAGALPIACRLADTWLEGEAGPA